MTGLEIKEKRRLTGVEQTELAKALGINPHTISRWERGDSKVLSKHWDNINKFFEEKSVIDNANKCLYCGTDITHMAVRTLYCSKNCNNAFADAKNHRPQKEWLEIQRLKGVRQRLISTLRKKIERIERMQTVSCSECGRSFETINRNILTCSKKCSRKRANRIRNPYSSKKLNENNIVDKDISLGVLFKRDKGLCYLCGEGCDWKDYTVTEEGHWIVGEKYPSIDHVRPISLGGLHAWNNVLLAHHRCNILKSDVPLECDIEIHDAYKYKREMNPRRKETNMLSLDGKLIKTFKSTAQASRETGYNSKQIQNCARGECETYKGYVWEYV